MNVNSIVTQDKRALNLMHAHRFTNKLCSIHSDKSIGAHGGI